jgi:hypothetical protein
MLIDVMDLWMIIHGKSRCRNGITCQTCQVFFTSDCWWRLKSERPVCEVSLRFQELEASNLIRKKDQKGMSVEGLKIYGATKHSQVEKHGSCHVRTRHIRHTFPSQCITL